MPYSTKAKPGLLRHSHPASPFPNTKSNAKILDCAKIANAYVIASERTY